MIFGFNTDVKVGKSVYHVQSEARKKEHLLQTQIFLKGQCIGKHATSYADKLASPNFSDEQMHALLKQQHKHIVQLVRAGNVGAAVDALAAKSVVGADASDTVAAVSPAAPAAEAAVSDSEGHAAAALSADCILELPQPAPSLLEVSEEMSVPMAAPEPHQAELVLSDLKEAPPPPSRPATAAVSLEPVGIAIEKGLKLEWIPTEAAFADNNLMVQLQVLTDDGQPVAEAQLTARLTIGQTAPAYIYAATDSSGNAALRSPISPADLPECAILVQASFRGKSASRKLRVRLHT